jgi:hypothetical protein
MTFENVCRARGRVVRKTTARPSYDCVYRPCSDHEKESVCVIARARERERERESKCDNR